MGNSNFYIKGNYEDIITRISQVHTITMFCPMSDHCVQGLKNTFEIMLAEYKKNEDYWENVPTIDALNAFIFNDNMNRDYDSGIFSVIVSSLKMFNRLKRINFQFTNDEDILNSYKQIMKNNIEGTTKYIYNVDVIEMNLSEMFSQMIIDMLNRIFICNEYLPNSYLDRKFMVDFKYDDYMSFMDMVINNNKETLDALDDKICDYFKSFPKLVMEQKPNIRVVTNYSE